MQKTLTLFHRYKNWFIALSLFSLSFSLYYQGLAPSVSTIFDDSLEFALVVHDLAIAHPTGYPLYTLLGKLFSLPSPTNVAYQLNIMSAFFAALTVALLYGFGLSLWSPAERHLPQQAGAILGAMLFAVGPIFYSQATIAEVYTLNAFFVALMLLLAVHKRWHWLALVVGLSLTHHRTTLLILPGLGLYALFQEQFRAKWQSLLPKLMALSLLPLLLYAYLPLRGHVGSLDGRYQHTLAGFWQYILGGGYSSFLLNNVGGESQGYGLYLWLFQYEAGWMGLFLGLAGLIALFWQNNFRSTAWLTSLTFLIYLTFNIAYAIHDIDVFFIPLFLLTALWAGLALALFLAKTLADRPIVIMAFTLAAILTLMATQRGQNRANDWDVHYYGLSVLAQMEPNSAVVGILGEITLLNYMQAMTKPDLNFTPYPAETPTERLDLIKQAIAEDTSRPLYLTCRFDCQIEGLPQAYALSSVGPLVQILPEPLLAPPTVAQVLDTSINQQLRAYGYSITHPPTPPYSHTLRLNLVWQVDGLIQENLKVSARLVDGTGQTIASVDSLPVQRAYPSTTWRPGEFIHDSYDLQIPTEAPQGPYQPLIIVYQDIAGAPEVDRMILPEVWFPSE